MIKEAMEFIQKQAQPQWAKVHGLDYASRNVSLVLEPEPEELRVTSLTAIALYLKENPDAIDLNDLLLVVDGPLQVFLFSRLRTGNQRFSYLRANPVIPNFNFSQFTPLDQFVPQIQAGFLPTQSRDSLIQVLSHVSHDTTVKAVDDGTAQEVEVRSGIRKVYQDLPNPVSLQEYCTFPEIEQPMITYVLRLDRKSDSLQARLIQADGGAWRITAMERIRNWLANHVSVSILA